MNPQADAVAVAQAVPINYNDINIDDLIKIGNIFDYSKYYTIKDDKKKYIITKITNKFVIAKQLKQTGTLISTMNDIYREFNGVLTEDNDNNIEIKIGKTSLNKFDFFINKHQQYKLNEEFKFVQHMY